MKALTMISTKTPKTRRPTDKKEFQISSSIRKTPFILDKRKKFTIGKLSKNNVVLKEGTISDIHASISWQKSAFRVKDEKSTNGTYVNGTRINKVTVLKDGDKIKIGKYVMTLGIMQVRIKTDEKKKKIVAKKVKIAQTKKPAAKKTVKTKNAKKPAAKSKAAKKPAAKKPVKSKAIKKPAAKKAVKSKAVKKPAARKPAMTKAVTKAAARKPAKSKAVTKANVKKPNKTKTTPKKDEPTGWTLV